MSKVVLHITAHLGGGVGKVLSGISSFAARNQSKYQHKIILLEAPEKLNFVSVCKENGVDIQVANNFEDVAQAMHEADIVQLEWWHHPKFAQFLALFPEVPARVVVWSHISGCNYPFLPPAFFRSVDKFIFTSDYSYENPYWQDNEREDAQRQCMMINSSGGFEYIVNKRETHSGFNIGYIGTQSFSKLNPDFAKYCKGVSDIPDSKFIMVGDKENQWALKAQVEQAGLSGQFEFVDYVNNVSSEFSRFDVFGYILNPEHYGTTENVLLEAMAAGLPVVCLNQCAEKFLVKHNETGLLVNNVEEYTNAMRYLYDHLGERIRLGNNAREFACKCFDVEKTVKRLDKIYDGVMCSPKSRHGFLDVFGDNPAEWFFSCLPPKLKKAFGSLRLTHLEREEIHRIWASCPLILKEKSKSSLVHFASYYPLTPVFSLWIEFMKIK